MHMHTEATRAVLAIRNGRRNGREKSATVLNLIEITIMANVYVTYLIPLDVETVISSRDERRLLRIYGSGRCGGGAAARSKMQVRLHMHIYVYIYVRTRAYIYSSSYAGWLTFLLSEKEVFALA